MKKVCCLLLVFLLAAAVLGACGAPSAPASVSGAPNTAVEPITITWYTPNWDEPESREMAAEFEALYPEIHVELVITEWASYKEKAIAALSDERNSPDLYTILLTDTAPFAKRGMLEPLNELGTAAGMDWKDFLKAALDATSVDGTVYCAPFRYDGSGVYYNVDMLREAGYEAFPETWEETLALCAALKAADIMPTAWYLGEQSNACVALVIQLYTEGGDILNEDQTKCLLDSDAAQRALGNLVETLEKGYASPGSLELDNSRTRDEFGAGSLAFVYSGPYDIDVLEETYPQLNFATAVLPGVDGMGCTQANGWGTAIGAHSKNKEAAARFLAYITTPENQARLTDSFPASYKASAFEQFSGPLRTPFVEQLENSRPEPSYDRWVEMQPIIYTYLQEAASGAISVEEACAGMTREIDALLAA